jgi:hypothetical protein
VTTEASSPEAIRARQATSWTLFDDLLSRATGGGFAPFRTRGHKATRGTQRSRRQAARPRRWLCAAPVTLTLFLLGPAHAEHATWLDGRWWNGRERSGAAIAALARDLAARGVLWVFPRAGTLWPSGGAPHATQAAPTFVRRIKAAHPALRVLPWVVGYTHRHLGRGPLWITRTARALARLLDQSGADGVHLDIEPPFGSFGQIPGARVASLARALRSLRPGALISFALHPVATRSFPRGLRPHNVRPLLEVADQVVVMMYDTGIRDAKRFARAVQEQVERLGTVARGTAARLWMGAAAYPAHRSRRFRTLHDPTVERAGPTSRALREALAIAADRSRWAGIGLFAHYSASTADWDELRKAWEADP